MNDQYIKNCILIKEHKINSKYEVLEDYSGYQIESELDRIFHFYTETLFLNEIYGIKPSILYFENCIYINAVASKQNDFYVVGIYLGTIGYLLKIFKDNKALIKNSGDEQYIEFEKNIGINLNELMYQQALHFTFYHEMAHLIQKTEFLESNLLENLTAEENFNFDKHIIEIDADIFASLSIGSHVLQFAKDVFKEKLTEEQLEKILVVICTSAFTYILSLQKDNSNIYYKENSHPHPIIRITLIVLHIVSYVMDALQSDGYKFNLTASNIVNKCLSFSSQLPGEIININLINSYVDVLPHEKANISNYILEVKLHLDVLENSACKKWNEILEKEK